MKVIIVIAALIAVSLARPQFGELAKIVRFEQDNIGLGPYSFVYETSDGQKRAEVGEIKNAGTDNEILVVHGTYSYVGPDGKTYSVEYLSDENGHQAAGEHLPDSANARKAPNLGIPSAALGSLVGGGLG